MSTCIVYSDGINPRTNAWEVIENLLVELMKNNEQIILFNRNSLDQFTQFYLKKANYLLVSIRNLACDPNKTISLNEWDIKTLTDTRENLMKAVVSQADNQVLVYGRKSEHVKRLESSLNKENVKKIYDSLNITSNSTGISRELSINDSTSYDDPRYPIVLDGTIYSSAYRLFINLAKRAQYFKTNKCQDLDCWLEYVMCLKFKQHPKLVEKVTSMGGAEWLSRCSHLTATSTQWNGIGANSKYITCLTMAYSSAYWKIYKDNKKTEDVSA